MTTIANNLRIAFSSKTLQNEIFDLSDLFLNRSLPVGLSFVFNLQIHANNGLPSSFTDAFEFTLLPSGSNNNQRFEIKTLQDLSVQAGAKERLTLQLKDADDAIVDEYQLEIEIFDASANTPDAIMVRENQLGQIFDPSAVDFGLTSAIESYTITAGGDYVRLNTNNLITLNPDFDPDTDNTTSFTFTVQASDGNNTADHTVTVTIELIDDTAPEIVANIIDVYHSHLTKALIVTEEMISYTDENPQQIPGQIQYIITGDQPTGVTFVLFSDANKTSKTTNVSTFTHQDILNGLVGLEFTDLTQIDGFNLHVSDGFNISKAPVFLEFRREFLVEDADQSTTIDFSAEVSNFKINAGYGYDTVKTGQGDDIIIGGMGRDIVDLSGGGDDTVIYQFSIGLDGNVYAKDGNDRVINFELGKDKLVFKPNFENNNIRSFDEYMSLFKGKDNTWRTQDDQMQVSPQFSVDGSEITVSGLIFHFRHSGPSNNGFYSNPKIVISFLTKIPFFDFFDLIDMHPDDPNTTGFDNFDKTFLKIIDLSVLPQIFGNENIVFADSTEVLAVTSGHRIVLEENQDYSDETVLYTATSNKTGVEWSLVKGGELFNIDAGTGEIKLNHSLNFSFEDLPQEVAKNRSIIIRAKLPEKNDTTEFHVLLRLIDLLELEPNAEVKEFDSTQYDAG